MNRQAESVKVPRLGEFMVKRKSGLGSGVRWRTCLIAAGATLATLWSSAAMATITQGDFSVFGFFETRESGRWGEGGAKDNTGTPTTFVPSGGAFPSQVVTSLGKAATESGGSFDFNHWDLVESRQLADIRPDYHMVKNYKFLGRLDTMILKDADFFAFYRPWYDAFGSIKKSVGRAEPNRDWEDYSQRQLQQQYFRDDLREYYAQLNFTDNFSMRVGKQQIIWSEADALSGTEITNSTDATYHWVHFETPENQRKNIRMVKFNYILPDFLKTANNEFEAVWIPGDFQGDGIVVNTTDARNPWVAPLALGPNTQFNERGQPTREQTLADQGAKPLFPIPLGGGVFGFLQENVLNRFRRPSNSIANNSEFAIRASSLLPIGSGLQASFIYLFEARNDRLGLCTSCGNEFGFIKPPLTPPGVLVRTKFAQLSPGVFLGGGMFDFGPPLNGATVGSLRVDLSENYLRRHWFGLTGTYYDKDLTDMVFRYDVLYAPKFGIALSNGLSGAAANAAVGTSGGAWTQQTRWILAADRPTYIPWLSKQHTFLTFQYVNTWYPDRPSNAAEFFGNFAGKLREDSNFAFFSAVNWMMNGQLTTTNVIEWDFDNGDGALGSTNVYRYSRNVLLGLNAQWYLGRSGRFTDPFVLSRGQRINELEATLSYEI